MWLGVRRAGEKRVHSLELGMEIKARKKAKARTKATATAKATANTEIHRCAQDEGGVRMGVM